MCVCVCVINQKPYISDKHATKAYHKTHNQLTLLIYLTLLKTPKGFCFVTGLEPTHCRIMWAMKLRYFNVLPGDARIKRAEKSQA